MIKKIKIILIKSLISRLKSHKCCAFGLGLYKINDYKIISNTAENMGMVHKIRYLLKIEDFYEVK